MKYIFYQKNKVANGLSQTIFYNKAYNINKNVEKIAKILNYKKA